MTSGIDAYRRIQREATPDEASMGTLLRVLVDSILVGRRALMQSDFATSNKHLIAAQQVLMQLRSATRDLAGELGQNLNDLYAWAEMTLGKANTSHDAALIDSVVSVLSNVRDGFEGVSEGG
jgi:flagellar protein FliS